MIVAGCTSASSTSPTQPPPAEAPAPPLPALGMNDVSVLLPLPASPATPGYLKPKSAGERGELLPKAVFDAVPPFPVKPPQGLDFARMRAIAIRFDGCFPAPSGCEPQIRIVMQPISDQGESLDSALHLFYRLTEPELAEVVTRLRQLRVLAPEVADAPLDVHGAALAQGMEGPYAQGLNELVLAHAGEQNLSRMTFFLRAPPVNDVWFFGGFDRKNGAMEQLDIVGVGKSNQRVILETKPDGFLYDFLPVETKPEDTSLLLSSAKADASSEAEVKTALEAFARIENPKKYGPDQLPCAGCHVGTAVADRAAAKLGGMTTIADAFTSARDLTIKSDAPKTPASLRAFGWFKKKPMISRRVVNETAGVVDDLEARFPVAK
jgi:hypothetical protein